MQLPTRLDRLYSPRSCAVCHCHPMTCPCVLELGHRLSLVAVVRSADQRLAIAIIQEQTVAKKDPGTETGESCWLASKARLARNQGVLTQPRRFTEGE